MKTNQKGFSAVEAVVVVLIVGLIGAVGWFVWDRQQSKSDSEASNTSNQSEKEDAELDGVTTANANEGYLVLKEWGLRFKAPSGLQNVEYIIRGDTTAFYAKPTGSNVQYRSDYDTFENGVPKYAVGMLIKSAESSKSNVGNGHESRQGKKVGNYYYYTGHSFSSLALGSACIGLFGESNEVNCVAEGTVFQLINQGESALLNTIDLAQ